MDGTVDTQSPAYRQGFADGQSKARAESKKWSSIAQMWGGLGLFLFLVLYFVALPMYNAHLEQAVKHDKLVACSNAADVPACVKALDK